MSSKTQISSTEFSILNHVPLGICIIDRDYKVIFWNTTMEDWCDITAGEITGCCITDRFIHFKEPRYSSRIENIFDGGAPAIFSSQLHSEMFPSCLHNGEQRIEHIIVTPVPSSSGKDYYAMFSITDISELTYRILDYRAMRDKALQEVEQRKRTENDKEELITQLKEALNKVNTLSDLLPICSACKKIRDDQGYWQQVENYMSQHVPVKFTHSLCPECAAKLYPELYNKKKNEKQEK